MEKPTELTTLKELYERLIVLETKLDLMGQNNLTTRKHFAKISWLILGAIIADIVIHYILFAYAD